ncbi:MAG: HAD family phosphatase, partial [Alloprevotella tannerae]|nr:HAD family phosphatase [Alloprevotella tannerae]
MVLLFDMGGVLVDLDLDLTLAGFDQIGIDLRPYLDSARQAGFLSDYESGKINTETMLNEMRALSTKSDLTDDEIAAAW